MTQRPWMPLYVADYLADTGHLTGAEHGAYLLLIMHYWANHGLPTDDKRLASIARMSHRQWTKSREIIRTFFGEGWSHKRIDEELARVAEISNKRKDAALERHSKKTSKSNANADANAVQKQTHSHSHTQVEDSEAIASDADKPRPDARTTLFREGLASLRRTTGKTEGQLRPLIGGWLRDQNDDAVRVFRAIEDAERNRVAEPVAWITRALKPKDRPPDFITVRKQKIQQEWDDVRERLREYSEETSDGPSQSLVRLVSSADDG